jgi:outer membrane protein assembly factor BamB
LQLLTRTQGDTFYAVEAVSGGLGSMMRAALIMYVNKLVAYDATSGALKWKKSLKLDEGFLFSQVVDDKMFFQYEKDRNVYDYSSGESLWKRVFEKKINDIEKN